MRKGILAEFDSPEAMLRAIRAIRERGYRRLDAFSPYAIDGAAEALGLERSPITWIVLPVALTGAATAYWIQWFCNALDYPIDVGGRQLHSVPAFIPVTFEMAVLSASLMGFFTYLFFCKLPELYSPIFDVPGFERASIDRFWVGVDERDPSFNVRDLESAFLELGALRVERAKERS